MPRCFKKGNRSTRASRVSVDASSTECVEAGRFRLHARRVRSPRADTESCAGKVYARPAALTTTFTTFGLSSSADAGCARRRWTFRFAPALRPRRQSPSGQSRFVALDVHHRVALATPGDFGDAIGTARMFRACHFRPAEFCATSQMRVSSVATMTSLNDFAFCIARRRVDQRLAGDERERLAGEPRRGVTRGMMPTISHGVFSHSPRRLVTPKRNEGGNKNRRRIELKTVQVTFTSTMSNNPTESFKLRHRNKMRMMIFTGKRTILGR